MAPTTTRDAVEAPKIEVTLTLILGKDYFRQVEEFGAGTDSDLSRFLLETRLKAFDWIINQDPMQLEYNAPNLVQRFLLVLFYYQTTRHKPWKECNPAGISQASATTNFCYQPVHLTGEATSLIWGDQWLSPSHECQWAGVDCQSEKRTVAELRIHWNHLNGPLPWEVTRLPLLRTLWLNSNMLTGALPPRLFSKNAGYALDYLDLRWNQFSGTIPAEWVANLLEGNGVLAYLQLNQNALTGRIPSELGLLSLKSLILTSNTLTGSIPRDLFYQTSLEWLFLEGNDLTGTLPSEIGLLTNLSNVNLNFTQISGAVPSEIGVLSKLVDLILSNTKMQGTIAEELYKGLGSLEVLSVSNCNLSGTINTSLGLMTHLKRLHFANNHFHGTIPNEIEALTQLAEFLVNGNDLSGTVPISFCQTRYAGEVASKVVADCLPNTETGIPAIQCSSDCCTSCCDETGVCLSN
ncbi:leucine Rich Repeat [Seminavis robusta]|uniref:Leucine Rich Repeat n=1 Tax=Seminavis robusta TaxID=568900 RepID=A0A9N8DW63_9STRA|nr:leucine Rich Repeat [Seminavis robusta]|eukprot:Sro396_g134360.1 leucine Rich Repeat (464) ;mRNA; r:59455-61017